MGRVAFYAEDMEDLRPPLEERIMEVRQRLARLQARIAACCPGTHRYTNHHDLRPPWCDACHYCDCGVRISELGHAEKD